MATKAELNLDLMMNNYNRDMRKAIESGKRLDDTMEDVADSAKRTGKEFAKIGDKKVSIDVDSSKVGAARREVNSLDGLSPTASVLVDNDKIRSARGEIMGLNGLSPRINPQLGDIPTGRIKSDIESVRATVKPKADASAAASEVKGVLESINAKVKVGLLMDTAGAIKNTFTGVPILSTIQDNQQATNLLKANLVDVEAGMEAVQNAWVNNWGASKVEIAGVVAELQKLNVPEDQLADATMAVFELTAGGKDLNETFTAQKNLVTSGLVGSFREAADVMAAGFAGPAGSVEDYLDTLMEYSSQVAGMNMPVEQFVNLMNEGILAGAWNTDVIGDTLKEMNLRFATAMSNSASTEGVAFRTLLGDEAETTLAAYEAGKISGAELLRGLTEGATETGNIQALWDALGGSGENFSMDALLAIDWTKVFEPTELAGSASTMASTFTDTLGGDWATLMRTMSDGFLGVVDGMTGGIDEWVKETRNKIQVLGGELRAGTGLPEALEIALEAPGLADKIRDLEAGLGNFVIEFQLVLASVLDFLGKGEAAAGVRTAVADQSANQLEYELKFADDQGEVTAAIMTAIRRGVDEAGLAESINQVTAEMIGQGMESEATALLEMLRTMGRGVVVEVGNWGLNGAALETTSVVIPVDPELTPEAAAAYAEQVALVSNEALELAARTGPSVGGIGGVRVTGTEILPAIDITGAQAALDAAVVDAEEIALLQSAWNTLTSLTGDLIVTSDHKTGEKGLGFENLIDFTDASGAIVRFKDATLLDFNAVQEGTTTAVETLTTNTEAAFGEMAFASDVSVEQVNAASAALLLDLQTTTPAIVEQLEAIESGYEGIGQAAYDAWIATGGSAGDFPGGIRPDKKAAGGVMKPGFTWVGESGRELMFSGGGASILNNRTSEAFAAGMNLSGMGGRGGGTQTTNNYFNLTNVFNTNGNSAAINAGEHVAKKIRGM